MEYACRLHFYLFFFFNDTATTEIYTLSLHDALPISRGVAAGAAAGPGRRRRSSAGCGSSPRASARAGLRGHAADARGDDPRSEEHTSELQSRLHLVCRLLLEKKKK